MLAYVNAVKMPHRHFMSSKPNPATDLHSISQSQASIITRVWLREIVLHNPTIALEDECIVSQINRFEAHVQSESNQDNFYVVWVPEPSDKGGNRDALFVLASSVNAETNRMCVKLLVQSPFWCTDQIHSTALKDSLESLASTMGNDINFSDLYKVEPRYKLEWENWLH